MWATGAQVAYAKAKNMPIARSVLPTLDSLLRILCHARRQLRWFEQVGR
jgi:hypothetical protein